MRCSEFYPGSSGYVDEAGEGRGLGANINIAWQDGGAGDADYMAAMLHVVLPIAYEFQPDIVLVSAGFDAAASDPLGKWCI